MVNKQMTSLSLLEDKDKTIIAAECDLLMRKYREHKKMALDPHLKC